MEEKEYIFKSRTMKNIMQSRKPHMNRSLTTFSINQKNIEKIYKDGELSQFIEDIRTLFLYEKNVSNTKLSIENINLADYPEIATELINFSKISDEIEMKNVQVVNFKDFFNESYINPEDINTEDVLKIDETLYFDKFTKTLEMDSKDLDKLDICDKCIDSKELIVNLSTEEYKQDITNNIDVLKNREKGEIHLKDVTQGRQLSREEDQRKEKRKYENYANGYNILIESDILKKSMGIDKMTTEKGDPYMSMPPIVIDGAELTKDGKHKLEGQELETFLKDIEEISKYTRADRISIKNVDIPENVNLDRLAETLGKMRNIRIENSNIPNLEGMINNIEDKSNLDGIIIKNSGIEVEDIDRFEFENLEFFNVKNEEIQKNIITENNTQEMNQNQKQAEEQYLVEVKETWYQRAWNRAKAIADKILGRNQQKALPEEATNPDKLSNEGNKAKEFASSMQKGVNLDELDRVARESQEQSRAEQSRTKQDIELEDRE